MADIRLNLIADLGAFQGALASAVTQAKSTVAPVKVTATIDRDVWKRSLIDAKTLLGTYLKTYKTTIQLDTAKANTQIIALRNKLETDIGGLVLEPIVKPIVDFTDINKLKKEIASVATKPTGASRGEAIADLLGKTKGEGGVNIGAIKAIAKELGVAGSSGQELRKALQDLFRAAGEDSIAGLEEGLKRAYATGTTAAKDFSDGFKDGLGIASPSKLFQKFGQFCVEGIANGLLKIDAAAKNAAKDFGYNFETQLNREIQEVGIEKYANQLGKRFGEAFGDSVGITIRGSIDAALSTVMVKGGLAAILGGGKAAIGALPSAAGETGGIAVKTAGLVAQLIKDAFLAGPEELGRNLVANVQAIVSSDSGSIAAAIGKITTAFVSGALDAGLEAIRANPQAIGQAAVAGAIAGTGAVVLKKAVPALYDSLVNAIARKVASDIQFTIQAIRNPQQAFAGIQLAIGQVQVSIGYLVQAERRLAGVTIQYGQTAYQLSSELGQSAAGLLKGVVGFLRSTGLVVTALRGGEVGLLDAAKALIAIEGFRRQQIPQGTGFNDPRLLAPTPGRISGNEFAMSFGKAFAQMAGGFINFSGGGGGGRKPPFILPFGEDPNQYGGPIGPASRFPYVSARQFNLPGKRREVAQTALSSLGVEQTGGIDQQKKALAQVSAAYRNGVVSAKDFVRAQLSVAKSSIDAALPLKGLRNSLRDLGSQFAEAGKDILFYGAAYQALGAIQQLPRNIYEAVKAQDSFANTLKASLGAGDTYGQQVQFLTQLSEKYGLNIANTREGFVKLFASLRQAKVATQDVNNLQESVAIIGTAFKLSPDKLDRVTYALGQIASKGQLTSEELKGQLGDVLPGAVSQFAEAAGFKGPDAIAKFNKALEDGKFQGKALEEVLRNWSAIVKRDFTDAALQAGDSIQGLENRLANANTKFLESFKNGLGQVLPQVLDPVIGGLTNAADALDVLFGNSQKRVGQLQKNLGDLQRARDTGIADVTNLEVGLRAGRAVDKKQVNQQIADTLTEIGDLQERISGLNTNTTVQGIVSFTKSVTEAGTAIATVLKPAFDVLVVALKVALDGIKLLADFIRGVPKPVLDAALAFVVFYKALAVGGIIASTAQGIVAVFGAINALGGILPAATLAARTFWLALTGPVGLVGLVVAALAAIGVALFQNNKEFRDWVTAVTQVVQQDFASAMNTLKSIGQGAIDFFSGLGKAISDAFGGLGGIIGNKLQEVTGKLNEWYNKLPKWAQVSLTLTTSPGGIGAGIINVATQNFTGRVAQQQRRNQAASSNAAFLGSIGLGTLQSLSGAQLAEQLSKVTPTTKTTSGGAGTEGAGGKSGKTPKGAKGTDLTPGIENTLQQLTSSRIRALIEQSRLQLETSIQRLFPRGAGIFQPFVDAYKGVFDFLANYQEKMLSEMEASTKGAVSTYRLNSASARGLAAPTASYASMGGERQVFNARRPGGGVHQGYDIGANPGTAVFAMASGKVKDVYQNFNRGSAYGGKGLVIQGDDGVTYVYGHVEGLQVGRGATVTAGQPIASVANLGDQSHLHMEMRDASGRAFDPSGRITPLYAGRGRAGGGMTRTTALTTQQKAQLKQEEQAAEAARQSALKAFLGSGAQNILNLFRETSLKDPFSKISESLLELERRVEDFGSRANEAFTELLPNGIRESQQAILAAQRGVVDAKRGYEDIQNSIKKTLLEGEAANKLFGGGPKGLNLEEVKQIDAALKAAGSNKTLVQLFEEAGGNAQTLLNIIKGIANNADAAGRKIVSAAEAIERIKQFEATLAPEIARLGGRQQIAQALGLETGGIAGRIRQLEIDKEINQLRESRKAAPENADFIDEQIQNLTVLRALNESFLGTTATVGEVASAVGSTFRTLFNDLGQGFAEAIVQGTSFFDALTSAASNFFQALGRFLVDLAAQQAAAGILSFIGKLFSFGAGFGSTSFGSFDLTGGAGGGFGSFAGSTAGSFGTTPGIGGFDPNLAFSPGASLPGFADGGLVNAPTVALIGEGRYNEAIVPLPNGRSIPVQFNGDPFEQNRAAMTGGSMFARDSAITSLERSLTAPTTTTNNNSSVSVTGGAGGVSYNFQTTRVLGEDLVTTDQLVAATTKARQEGAAQGARLAIEKLRQSPQTRRSVGF